MADESTPPPTQVGASTPFRDLVLEALERGDIIRTQAKTFKDSREAYAYFKFNGGVYDGIELRLYPPFGPFTHGKDTWNLERQFDKKGKQLRSIYTMER